MRAHKAIHTYVNNSIIWNLSMGAHLSWWFAHMTYKKHHSQWNENFVIITVVSSHWLNENIIKKAVCSYLIQNMWSGILWVFWVSCLVLRYMYAKRSKIIPSSITIISIQKNITKCCQILVSSDAIRWQYKRYPR